MDAYFRICNTSATCRRRCICLFIKAFIDFYSNTALGYGGRPGAYPVVPVPKVCWLSNMHLKVVDKLRLRF